MTYLVLTMLAVIIFAPLAISWGKNLLIYCVTVWLLLWGVIFFQIKQESNLNYDVGIVSDSVVLGGAIIMFIVIVGMRSLAQYISIKMDKRKKLNERI